MIIFRNLVVTSVALVLVFRPGRMAEHECQETKPAFARIETGPPRTGPENHEKSKP